MGVARIQIRFLDDELVVHEWTRVTSRPTTDGLQKLAAEALGWLQAYGSQLDHAQWQQDKRRAEQAQREGL